MTPYLITAAVIAALCWLWWLAITAPEGWQDDDGYHDGRKDEDHD